MAGIGTGVDAQVGFVAETTYGTAVTVTRFLEFQSETIKAEVGQYTPLLLGRGDTPRGANARTWVKGASGDIVYVLQAAGFGLLFKHLLGAIATTGSADPYTHTATPDAVGLKGLFQTLQIGRPSVDGTVQPFTYSGVKITKVKIEAKVDGEVTLTVSYDGWKESTSVALATASYAATATPLIFADGSATIGGSAISIKSFSLEIDTGLKVDRRFIGNTKKEPLRNAEFKVTGNLEYEFEALTRHTDLTAGTLLTDLIITIAEGSNSYGAVITIPQMLYTPGGEPNVAGPDVVAEAMPWMALNDDTNDFITIAYVTADATP